MIDSFSLFSKATIRNARVCESLQNQGFSVKFNKDFDTKGWVHNNSTMFGSSAGFAFLTATNQLPNIFHSSGVGPIDSSIYTEVVIRYKYIKNRTDSIANLGSLQFLTTADPVWNSDKEIEFEVIPDGKWHSYILNLGPLDTWVGLVNNLRVYFAKNGAKGDEVFISDIRVREGQFNFCFNGCITDSSTSLLAENFDIQTIGSSPAGWSLVNTDSQRLATIDPDPEHRTSNNNVIRLSTTFNLPTGPRLVRSLENHSFGYFSCRVRTDSSGLGVSGGRVKLVTDVFSENPILEISFESDGFIKYRSGAGFVNFENPFSFEPNVWYSLLITYNTSLSFFDISIDGINIAERLPIVFSDRVNGIVLENPAGEIFSFWVDDILVVKDEEVNSNCPGIGKQGEAIGGFINFERIDILKDINDSLIVNIDNYGDVAIKLPEQNGVDPFKLRLLLERVISSIDVGGYTYAEVDFVDRKFTIRSGTYDFDSTVEIKKNGSSTLSEDLKFTVGGNQAYTGTSGRPHAAGFSFTNGYRATSYDLTSLLLSENKEPIVQFPANYSPNLGQRRSGFTGRGVSIEGTSLTLIDFYNRANTEGLVNRVRVHGNLPVSENITATGDAGVASGRFFDTGSSDLAETIITSSRSLIDGAVLVIDEPGYPGNGEYKIVSIIPASSSPSFSSLTKALLVLNDNIQLPFQSNLSWSILSISKVKHFRPNLDGTLNLVNEVSIGIEQAGVLYTRDHTFYEVPVNWRVRRGDLIGIYNAINLFSGNDPLQTADALYIQESGDLIGNNIRVSSIEGEGIEGIGLRSFGESKEDTAIYDIDLGSAIAVETIDIFGEEDVTEIDYNVLTAIGNGVSISVDTKGLTHNHLPVRFSDSASILHTHPNIPYNIFTLTDGISFPTNGVAGSFESNDPLSTYFYVDGDGEWIDIEFPEPTWIQGTGEAFNFREDPISIIISWDIGKNVHRLRSFFKEFPHFAGYQIEYLNSLSSISDGAEDNFVRIGGFEEGDVKFQTVKLDDKLYEREIVQNAESSTEGDTHVHFSHFEKSYDVYYKGPEMSIEEKRKFDSSLYHPYTVLDKTWETVNTKAINFYTYYHYSTKISEIELFSKTSSESDLRDVIDLFYSINGESFTRAEVFQEENNHLKYLIGSPVRYIRIITKPFNKLTLDKIEIVPDSDLIVLKDKQRNKITDFIELGQTLGQESQAKIYCLTNNTGNTSDLEISVDTKEAKSNVILKSSLNSLQSITEPEVGPPGQVYLDSDYDLPVIDNVAINSKVFALQNIAKNKKAYIMDEVDSESDIFSREIDPSKWNITNVNFPQTVTTDVLVDEITYEFPGFSAVPFPKTDVVPVTSLSSKLTTTWKPLGSFTATINCQYDPQGTRTQDFGSEIGIVDSTGRTISLKRRRVLYSQFGILNSYADYIIQDSDSGVVSQVGIFCQGGCGTVFGNSNDSLFPYDLRIERYKDESVDNLIFTYRDLLNFDNNFQWGKTFDPAFPDRELGFVIDLNALATPLSGDINIFIKNNWNRSAIGGSTGTPNEATFLRINNFKFFGESTYAVTSKKSNYFLFTGPNAEIGVTNFNNDVVANPVTLVALDLGNVFKLDAGLLSITSDSIPLSNLWSPSNILFSSDDLEDPNLVRWGNITDVGIRWILYQEHSTSSLLNIKTLHKVGVYQELLNNTVSPLLWEDLGNVLTDGSNFTYISQLDYPVIAIRMDNQFRSDNFKLISRDGKEYSEESTSPNFNGWHNINEDFPNLFYNISFTRTEDPSLPSWRGWSSYPSIDQSKEAQSVKWFAFRNTLTSENQEVSEFIVSTQGLDSSDVGQQVDRVDFTEYSTWFDNSQQEFENVAEIGLEEFGLEGVLYGSSEQSDPSYGFGGQGPGAEAVFDREDNTELLLRTDVNSIYFYRVFGTASGVGDVTTLQGNSVDLEDEEVGILITPDPIVILEEREISYIEFELSSSTSAVPRDFELQRLIDSDPSLNSSWETISGAEFNNVENFFGEFVFDSFVGLDSFSTNGEFFRYDFDSPISVSGIRVLMTAFEDVGGRFNIINIRSFRAYQRINSEAEERLTIENDPIIRQGGRRSLRLTYIAGSTELRTATAAKSLSLSPDNKWSIQDFLAFYIRVDNLIELDLERSYIRLGKDETEFYEWGLDSLENPLQEGELLLNKFRFRSAREKGGNANLYESTADLKDLAPQTNFKDGPIAHLEIGLAAKTANSDITIWLDNFHIERENFSLPGKFNSTLYLTNSELVYFPMTGFDMRKGYFECIITPDWDSEGLLEVTNGLRPGDQVYTIFSASNSETEYMSLYYTTRQKEGLRFVVNTTDSKLDLVIGDILKLKRYDTHLKIGLLWDNEGKRINKRSGSTARIYLDDILIGDLTATWNVTDTRDTYFFIGSKTYVQAASSPLVQFVEFGFNIEVKPTINSLKGGIENILLLSDPIKLDFEKVISLKDRILLSKDGISFYPGSSPQLPLTYSGIMNGEEVSFYVKTDLPQNIENMPREGFIKARWLKTV